ncbi:MAG TPA: 3'-5' exonuclease, partial [Thermomicrobiales bacterium]|nr:3'-5' exonuclease [Thermomicrobiales bacterium]
NYRCPRTILARSSQLIKQNRNRVAKHPESGVDAPGTILLSPADDQLAGSRLLVDQIRDTIASHEELDWGDIAILARRNQHLDEMQVQLITAGIPHVVKSGRDLVRTWTTALSLLDLSTAIRQTGITRHTGFTDAVAAYTWFPRQLRENAGRMAGMPLDACLAELTVHGVSPASQKRFQDALALLGKQRTVVQELTIIESRFLGIDTTDRKKSRKSDESDGDEERTQDLPLELLRTILGKGESTRNQAIDRLRGFIERAHDANQLQGAKVELATYHGAKGRQWHTVVLPWVSNGTTPDPLTRPEFGQIEAERRLFYVAMTRAADTLVIGHPSPNAKASPSRFLFEAGLLEEVALAAPAKPSAPAPPHGATPQPATAAARPTPPVQRRKPGRTTTAYITPASIEKLLLRIRQEGGAEVDYPESPELLYPLQLALLLEGIPYQVQANHDLLHSWMLRELYRHITLKRLRIIKPVEEPEYPAYGRAYPALVAWLRHKNLDMPTAKAELDAAIESALTSRRKRDAPQVVFRQTSQH